MTRCCCVLSLSNNLFFIKCCFCYRLFVRFLISLSVFFFRSYFHFFFLSKAFLLVVYDFSSSSKSAFSAQEVTFYNKLLEV